MAGRSIEELRGLLGADADDLTDADVRELADAVDVFARQVVSVYREAKRPARVEVAKRLRRRA